MPASAPSGGLDRRFILGERRLSNTGADSSVSYQGAALKPSNGDILLIGNSDYVGLLSEGIFGELVEGAVLPATTGSMVIAVDNKGAGGWVLLDGANDLFLLAADLSAVSVITPPAATTRRGVVEYNGRLFTATASLNGPERDIEVSGDNGATWDSDPGIFTGINVTLQGLYTNPAQTILLAVANAVDAAVSTAANPITASWSLVPDGSGLTANHAAISDDGRKFVIVSSFGGITTSDNQGATSFTFPASNNPFQENAGSFTAITSVVYVAGMLGFILTSSTANITAFIAETNMRQIFVASYLGLAFSVPAKSVVSDGVQALWPGSIDRARCTLRNVGQLGKT